MRERAYYSVRTGKNADAVRFALPMLLRLFHDTYNWLVSQGYFQEAFGYVCVDFGEVHGELGSDIEAQMSRRLRKPNLWPIEDRCSDYSEDDLFDVVEFLYDCVSKPGDGYYHNFSNCGWHYSEFDKVVGQQEFRMEVNGFLRDYQDGYELSEDGEILALAEEGLDHLFEADVPSLDSENVTSRVSAAIRKFRHRSSMDDRRDAIRDLADVFEFLRPQLGLVLNRRDESDLFNIANNFGIRHHNESQQTNYDKPIWYSWMFYYYLATIHAATRMIEKQGEEND